MTGKVERASQAALADIKKLESETASLKALVESKASAGRLGHSLGQLQLRLDDLHKSIEKFLEEEMKTTLSSSFNQSVIKRPVSKELSAIRAEGGRARASSLTPERRTEIAKAAAAKRWNKKPPKGTTEGK